MKNLGIVESPWVQPQSVLKDPPLRNSLMYPRIKQDMELPDDFAINFEDLGGTVADNDALVAAFATKQDVLGFTPLNSSANLSDLTNTAEALENLGLELGGDNNIWLPTIGGIMEGRIVLYSDGGFQYIPGTLLSTEVNGLAEFDGTKLYITFQGKRFSHVASSDPKTSSTTVANTTDETTVFTTDIPSNSWLAGKILKLLLLGRYSTANGTDTVTIRFKIDGSTILSMVSTAASVTNAPLIGEFITTMRTIGATGTIWPFLTGAINNVKKDSPGTAATTVDTTGDLTFSVTVEWSAADAGNTLSVDQTLLTVT